LLERFSDRLPCKRSFPQIERALNLDAGQMRPTAYVLKGADRRRRGSDRHTREKSGEPRSELTVFSPGESNGGFVGWDAKNRPIDVDSR
jgi:hypothetical protein